MNKHQFDTIVEGAVDRMLARLDTSGMNAGTKSTIRSFLNRSTNEIIEEMRCVSRAYVADIEQKELRVADAEKIIKRAEELGEQYPDPRARQAMVMYNDIVNRYVEDAEFCGVVYRSIKDEQVYRNAILSAGRIVAAYLGGNGEENE